MVAPAQKQRAREVGRITNRRYSGVLHFLAHCQPALNEWCRRVPASPRHGRVHSAHRCRERHGCLQQDLTRSASWATSDP